MAGKGNYFWWISWIDRIIIASFWWVILMAVVIWVPFLRVWWWVFFPLFLAVEVQNLYTWWINWDYNYAKRKWVMLEIVPPKEVLTPLRAMEDIFTVIWGPLFAPANWRERYFEGELEEDSNWISYEVVSIEGALHFYIRVMASHRLSIETALYSHYPELEIQEVQDYTKNVPQNIPNEEWDVYGEDFVLGKPAPYPIKTYENFFEPEGQKIVDEAKRIDSMTSLLELMSKLGPGEQFWLQFTTIAVEDEGLQKEAKKLIDKLAGRPEKKHSTLGEEIMLMLHWLISGPEKEGQGEKASYSWLSLTKEEKDVKQPQLTPGEREVLSQVENKMRKLMFRTSIRGVYVAKREVFKASAKILTRSYFSHFNAKDMNHIRFLPSTRPKTQYFFRKRIPFVRSRRMFRNYILRFPPHFPNRKKDMVFLNVEEMATVFHFPIKITGLVAPTMSRVESKKGGPPPNLPTE